MEFHKLDVRIYVTTYALVPRNLSKYIFFTELPIYQCQ